MNREAIQAIVDRMKVFPYPYASKKLVEKWAKEIEAALRK
jgi:hypothetical protein